MVMKRIQMDKDDEGVSEVLGTILTLVITVLLFSSVFIGVQNLETPDQSSYSKFELSYEISTIEVENPEDGYIYHINITNAGGTLLDAEYIQIYLISDNLDTGEDTYLRYYADDDFGTDLDDGTWGIGDTFYIRSDNETNNEDNNEDLYKELKNPNTKVTLMIIDQGRNQVVWQDIVKAKGEIGPIVRRRGVDYTQSWENSADPGDTVTLYVYVIDKHEKEMPTVSVDLSELENYGGIEDMELSGFYRPYKENRYELSIDIDGQQETGPYLLNIIAENERFKTDTQYIVLNVGEAPISEEAELKVDPGRITVEPTSPVNGDEIIITSTIYNAGGGASVADITFYNEMPNGTELEVGTRTERFPSGGGRDIRIPWTVEGGGTHRITVDATEVANGIGEVGSRNLTVLPNILLVDDILQVDESQDSSIMRRTLDALNYPYDTYTVGGGDGPEYDDVLSDYDVAIWMTGEDTEDTLTDSDKENLETFLEEGNKLWLIGTRILDDTEVVGWIEDNLYATPSTLTRQILSPLRGRDLPTTINDTYEINVDLIGETNFIQPTGDAGNMLIDDDGSGDTIAVSHHDREHGTKTVFQPMLFSAIRESRTAGRTRLVSQVIDWMGNVTIREGTDLAITDQEFDNPNPNFMDTVTVTGTIRNNSPEPLSTDVTLEVNGRVLEEVHLLAEELPPGGTTTIEFEWLADEVGEHEILIVVDPYDRIDETTTSNNDIRYQGVDPILDVSFTTLMVDGETGNDQRGDATQELMGIYDDLGYVYEVYDVIEGDIGPDVDHMRRFNSVVWITGERNEDTLTIENIKNITSYHEEYTSGFTLIGDGVLEDLLNNGQEQHETFLTDVLKVDTDLQNSMPETLHGLENHPISHGMRYHLRDIWDIEPSYYTPLDGETLFEDSEGNTFAHSYYDSNYDSHIIHIGIDLMHFDTPIDNSMNEQKWYDEYDMSVSERDMREELIFLMNSWLGMFDERIELRVTHEDIHISNNHPFIGQGYVLTALIHNEGGTGTETLVRFKDGDSHIGSKSMYVPAKGSADVELKWEPINAGNNRPIRVIVDPLDEIAEVPNNPGEQTEDDLLQFNNQAIKYTPVYYFWDDMENGSDYWSHEAQLAMINGGNPLDFMGGDYDNVNTDVAQNWSETEGVEEITWDTYSDPKSYFMQEPVGRIGRRADAFVVMTIDNSRSMSNRNYPEGSDTSWLDIAKDSAKALIGSLSNNSVVGVWTYAQHNPIEVVPPTQLEGNRDDLNSTIDGIERSNMAPLWDTAGNAYQTVRDNIGDYPDLTPAVVVLGEGLDTMSSDEGVPPTQIEAGSSYWGPWHEMWPEGDEGENEPPIQPIESIWGKYSIPYTEYEPDDYGWWHNAGNYPGSQFEEDRRGLLYSDIPIFTIGLGLEHFGDPDNVDNPIQDPDWDITYDEPPQGDHGDSYPYHVYDCQEYDYPIYGTTEYQLWHIANTSGAEYFFAPDPDELEDIFETIGEYLSGPQNLTSVDPTPTSTDENSLTSFPHTEVENTDKYAVTPTLNLQNMSEAWLSFYHKYRIVQGVNGAYLEIGHNNGDGWHWDYVQPSVGPYTGNLLMQDIQEDDSGREIRWAWTGKSGQGTLQWDYVRLNIMNYLDRLDIDEEYHDEIRIRFYYNQFGGAPVPGGWIIDDISITASRIGDDATHITEGIHDVWQMKETTDKDGSETTAWWSGEPDQHEFRDGIDNSLMTTSIDLRNADTAIFNADFKFNINTDAGIPPDVVRVEITTDGGRSWESINIGARIASGVSSTSQNNYWIEADALDRLNVDLSDYSGNIIRMRFRVATNNDPDYDNFADNTVDFGGFYVNNVIISGRTAGS